MTPDIKAIDLEEALTVSQKLAEGNGMFKPKMHLHESDCLHRVLGEVTELQRKLLYYKKALEKINTMSFNALNNGP